MPPAEVRILVGPARSGKTERLLDVYCSALGQGAPGTTLWLSPTHRSCQEIRQRLVSSNIAASLGPGVMTFEELAAGVIEASPLPVRSVSRLQKRHLLRRLVALALGDGRLTYFHPIAETSGFIDLLADFISELKRLEVWPEELAKVFKATGNTAKGVELLTLYQAYQDQLNASQLYDSEGRFWSARSMLQGGQRRPFERLRLVIADGFTDFTRTQHEILEILADRVDRMHISLPMDLELVDDESADGLLTPRSHLFIKTVATLRQFRDRHRQLGIERATRSAWWPALSHIERQLFADPREVADAPDTEGIEILAAGSPLSELQHVGRRIKRLLLEGDRELSGKKVWPEDIAVVFRAPGNRAAIVREVFDDFGLPVVYETARRLRDAKIITAVVSLLRLDEEDWPFDQLLSVLSNAYLKPLEAGIRRSAVVAERVIRHGQIPAGRGALLGWLQHMIERDAEEPSSRPTAIPYRNALPWFQWLVATLDALPQQATPCQWGEALSGIVHVDRLCNVLQGADATADSSTRADEFFEQDDHLAWQRLAELLESLEVIDRHTDGHSKTIHRAELRSLLADLAATENLPEQSDETGCIRVMSAQSIRGLRVPYVFLVDLAEHVFPATHAEDRLYNEAETLELSAAGLPLRSRAEHNSEEMLLFYEVLTRATRRLFLSYAAWTEKADPLLPSPYLADVRLACGRIKIKTVEVHDLSPIPREDQPYSEREWRVLGVSQALDGRPALWSSLWATPATSEVAKRMLASVELCGNRRRGETFGNYEGMLDTAARDRLGERLGPSHVWSAAELEQYATCPFRFFAERILQLRPLEGLELETDYGRRGSVAHDALAALHRRLLVDGGEARGVSSLVAQEFETMLQEELARLLDVAEVDRTVGGAMRLIDRRRLLADLGGYVDSHKRYDAQWSDCSSTPAPAHFEVSFGLDDMSEDPLSTADPLEIVVHDETIKIGGRIDRIDLGTAAGEKIFNVLDYKTGRIPGIKLQTLKDRDALQLPLYMMATEDVLLGSQAAVAFAAGYWTFNRDGKTEFKRVIGLGSIVSSSLERTEQYVELREWLAERVWSLVHGARGGEFPMMNRDDKCTSTCSFGTVCRVNQVRSLEKLWQPPTVSTS